MLTETWLNAETNRIREAKKHFSGLREELKVFLRELCYPAAYNHCFISGGSIASVIQGERVNDYDLYFDSEDIAEHFKTMFSNLRFCMEHKVVTSSDKPKAYDGPHVFVTGNAVTIPMKLQTKLQIIFSKWGSPMEVINTFDFEYCRSIYIPWKDELWINRSIYKCITEKALKMGGAPFVKLHQYVEPTRIKKFAERGYGIRDGFLTTRDHKLNRNVSFTHFNFGDTLDMLIEREKNYRYLKPTVSIKVTT